MPSLRSFSMTRRMIGRVVALSLLVAGGASCGVGSMETVTSPSGTLGLPLLGDSSSAHLLQCTPPADSQTVTTDIGPLGGTLAIGNTSVVIPQGAVLQNTTFRLTIPASNLVEISVKAGAADHFLFAQPVTISIDYGRCASTLSPLQPVTAWHIDETSKALLENMTGVDLRLFHTITFLTGHLSGYAVAD